MSTDESGDPRDVPTPVRPDVLAVRRDLSPKLSPSPPVVSFSAAAFRRQPDVAGEQIDVLWARLDRNGVQGTVGGAGGALPADGAEAEPPVIRLRDGADLGRVEAILREWLSGTDLQADSDESN